MNGAVLKTAIRLRRIVGSNPTPSATASPDAPRSSEPGNLGTREPQAFWLAGLLPGRMIGSAMEQGKDILVNAVGLVVFLGTVAFVVALLARLVNRVGKGHANTLRH